MQLQMREQRQGGVVILAPEGRLDSGRIDEFDRAIQERIRKGHHRLLIDCTNVVFAASSALRVLLVTMRKLNEIDGKLVLCSMNPHILGIFENSGFTRLMNIRGTFEEGLAEARPPGADTTDPEPPAAAEPVRTHAQDDETPAEDTPPRSRENIVKRTVLAPFRIIAAIGRFLIR